MKLKKQSWVIVFALMVLVVMSGVLATSPSRFLPERCNIGPEFTCEEYEASSSDGALRIKLSNNVGETIHSVSVVNAEWAEETVGPSSCNNISADTYRAGDIIEIICYFDRDLFPPSGAKMKFTIDMTYLSEGKTYSKPFAAEIFLTLDDDYPYASTKYVYRSSGFIIYIILTLILLAVYIGAIIGVGKIKKIKMWTRNGLRAYFAGAIVLLLAFTFFIIRSIATGFIEFLEPISISIIALIISLCFAIVLYLPVTIVLHIIYKKKEKK